MLRGIACEAFWEWEVDGDIVHWSGNLESLFGYKRDEVNGNFEWWRERAHPDDLDRVLRESEEAMRGDAASFACEYRFRRGDNSWAWVASRAAILRDSQGKALRMIGAMIDVTLMQHHLEVLSRKLVESQEAERREVSNELHDDLGQLLFAIKLNLQRGGHRDSESMRLIDGAIGRMRDIVRSLRPPLIDETGLEGSIRHFVEREATRAGLAYRLILGPLEQRPPSIVAITCFRLAQEAVSNVIRHAQARTIDIELEARDRILHLVVHDDGRGFDVAVARARATSGVSQGLLGMHERAALVGGDLEIDSKAGSGTTVRIRLPLDGADAAL